MNSLNRKSIYYTEIKTQQKNSNIDLSLNNYKSYWQIRNTTCFIIETQSDIINCRCNKCNQISSIKHAKIIAYQIKEQCLDLIQTTASKK